MVWKKDSNEKKGNKIWAYKNTNKLYIGIFQYKYTVVLIGIFQTVTDG